MFLIMTEKDFRLFLIREFGEDPLVCKIATAKTADEFQNALRTYESIRGQSIAKKVLNLLKCRESKS